MTTDAVAPPAEAALKSSDDADAPAVIQPLTGGAHVYAMAMLVALYMLNYLDRQVINILAEPIKHDLGLADWQLGLMTGLAFAVLFATLGVPIARLAERRSRPMIIATAVAVWSGFTVLCGLAQNFVQLVLARIGVGVGEAGGTPPAHSLIIDYTPPEKRSSALGVYGMGVPLGGLLGMGFGGLVADAYGWRTAFLMAGAPGLLFAVLVALTLREPRRALRQRHPAARQEVVSFGETLRVLRSKRTFWFAAAGCALKGFISYAHAPFTASFFLRNHGEALKDTAGRVGGVLGIDLQPLGLMGLVLGVMGGVVGAFAMWWGGRLGDRYGRRDPRFHMWLPAVAAIVCVPLYLAIIFTPSLIMALALMPLYTLMGAVWYGPAYTAAFSVVPARMRATASSIVLFFTNLIGLGLGPLIVGALSDLFAVNMGSAEGIRWALAASSIVGVAATWVFWSGARTMKQDLAT